MIATKWPSYCVRHPNKVVWVTHQFRQAYDYDRSPDFGQFSESPEDRATRAAVERLEQLAPNGRVEFAGRVDEARLAELYGRCLAVFYAPYDEDYGIVPYEAFMAEKPVITTTDAGGPLDVVADRRTGLVVEPRVDAVAEACAYLLGHEDEARAWGKAGRAVAARLSWRETAETLVAAGS